MNFFVQKIVGPNGRACQCGRKQKVAVEKTIIVQEKYVATS